MYLYALPISINKLIKTALSNGKIVQCNIEKKHWFTQFSDVMFHRQKCCEPFLQIKNKHFARKYFDDFGFWWAFQVCIFFITHALNIDLHSMRLKLLFIHFKQWNEEGFYKIMLMKKSKPIKICNLCGKTFHIQHIKTLCQLFYAS